MKKVLAAIRDGWAIVGITLFMLVALEFSLGIAYSIRKKMPRDDSWAKADAYKSTPWIKPYIREILQRGKAVWIPYVYWRSRPFNGKYLNINSDNLRQTWNPPEKDSNPRVFTFGGSTMWGTGARDDYTIPSLLSKKLAENKIEAQVTNFGESGYVSTQEVIALIREIQKGNIPELAIFYDGVNDTYSTFQQRVAGIPQNEFHRRVEFYSSVSPKKSHFVELIKNNLNIIRAIRSLRKKIIPNKTQTNSDPESESKRTQLASDTVSIIETNVEIIRALAKKYGFDVLYYWQPTVFNKPHLTSYEQYVKEDQEDISSLLHQTYDFITSRNLGEKHAGVFHDISDIFQEIKDPLFIDWCHIDESGNQIVADRIFIDVQRFLK